MSSSWGVVCTLCTVSPTLAAWFLLAQGRYGVPDVSTALTSPNVTSTSDTCFSFWFQIKVRLPGVRVTTGVPAHAQEGGSVDKLSIFLRTGGEDSLLWYYTPKLDYWEAGQTLLPKNDNFQVKPCVQAQ